jgi:hypothetical protein
LKSKNDKDQKSRRRRKRGRRYKSCNEEIFKIKNKVSSSCAYGDADKLEQLLKVRESQKEQEAMHMETQQRIVTENQMLKVVLYLLSRKNQMAT